jgi:class 3 adenylate cyclase
LEHLPTWEVWADDALAVLDAVDSERAAVLAGADAGPTAILFAATQPDRTQALVLVNTAARFLADVDYPWGLPPAELDTVIAFVEENWGTEEAGHVGQLDADPAYYAWSAKNERMACSAREAAAFMRQAQLMDVRHFLSSIQVPTLVLHRKELPFISPEQGKHLAEHIPGAQFAEVPGKGITIFTKPNGPILDHIEEFLTGVSLTGETDRALAAILFTDIVGSTDQAVALGDRRWRTLLESHDAVARAMIDQHRGRLVKLTGDGVLATFDGPGRAIRCAFALRDALEPLGIKIRAGLHTGEVELREDDIGGVGVHVAARVLDYADSGEVLASGAVPLLVAGSGIEFEDRGERELKGIPGTWKLFAVSE